MVSSGKLADNKGETALVSLVLPAYNEAENLPRVVQGIADAFRKEHLPFEIVVVNNGSKDDTPAVLEILSETTPELKTVLVFPNEGFGNGILAGLRNASGDILGFADADGQLPPEDLVKVCQELFTNHLDLSKGERVVRNPTVLRRIQSIIYSLLFRFCFGKIANDINGKPKFFSRKLYNEMQLSSKDWFLDAEVLIKASWLGAKIGETKVAWGKRLSGESKVRMSTVLEFLKNMWLYMTIRNTHAFKAIKEK